MLGTSVAAAAGPRTTSGASAVLLQAGAATTLRAQLNVTAVGGVTPTLDVRLEDSLDGTNWNTIGAFAQRVAAGREVINVVSPFADQVRVAWTVGGSTPSFTFDVVVYAE